jgi:hypothetical protein
MSLSLRRPVSSAQAAVTMMNASTAPLGNRAAIRPMRMLITPLGQQQAPARVPLRRPYCRHNAEDAVDQQVGPEHEPATAWSQRATRKR